MYYVVTTDKSLYEATVDLRATILRLGFSVLQVRELGAPGGGWEVACDEDCTVFAIENPRLTQTLLKGDMQYVLALPWRIAVFTEAGNTRIGFACPRAELAGPRITPEARRSLREIEEGLRQIVDEAR